MATSKQRTAAKRNLRKARAAQRSMSRSADAQAQPEGGGRRRPCSIGGGDYYRVEVRPQGEFVTFRTHDIGEPGHVQRIAGKRRSGSWDDQTWLISKSDAHVQNGELVADTADAAAVLEEIGPAHHAYADRFEGRRRNGPRGPTSASPSQARGDHLVERQTT